MFERCDGRPYASAGRQGATHTGRRRCVLWFVPSVCLLHCQARCKLALIGLPRVYGVVGKSTEDLVVGRRRCLKCAASRPCSPLQGTRTLRTEHTHRRCVAPVQLSRAWLVAVRLVLNGANGRGDVLSSNESNEADPAVGGRHRNRVRRRYAAHSEIYLSSARGSAALESGGAGCCGPNGA